MPKTFRKLSQNGEISPNQVTLFSTLRLGAQIGNFCSIKDMIWRYYYCY